MDSDSQEWSRLTCFLNQRELYVYDIRVAQTSSTSGSTALVSSVPLPTPLTISNAPNSIENTKSISSWQGLYQDRRAWAIRLSEDCTQVRSEITARYEEMDAIIKCLDAAVANLEISVKQIEPKYNELKKWVEPALAEHEHLATTWETHLSLAKKVPASPAIVRFMTRGEVTKANATLEDLIELETARKAGKLAPTARRRFAEKAASLEKLASQMYNGLGGLVADFDKLMNRSVLVHSTDADQLLQDIEAIVNQIDSDYRTSLSYGSSQRDLAQASKTASNHTERLVPSLKRRAKEMDDMAQYATEARNSIATESARCMKLITDITARHSNVRSQVNVLNQSEDDMTTFDYLRLIHQLPYMYASYLVEAIRRRDWVDKVKLDSSTLANEMALFQDEESKRRRRWHKMVGSMYGPTLDTNVVGLEVNMLGEDLPWPSLAKSDLDDFVQTLLDQGTDQAILDDIDGLIQELNAPTKQQSKRLKAFKNGSIHDAALGRSGLMIRGDDDLLRSLQDDKGKLDKKLKTAESRIRRLEDLLHRQGQAARPAGLFSSHNTQTQERRGSGSSIKSIRQEDRRRSSDGADPLLRRIAQLESDLREEKQRSAQFQKELGARNTEHEDMKDRVQEANSTKKDLLENLEALKREFVDERKSMEDEIKSLKARLEDTEDEMDHFDASRENEKANLDDKIRLLEAQVEALAKEKSDEALRAQGQAEYLRKESQAQREKLESSDRATQEAKEESRSLAKRLQDAEGLAQGHLESLQKVFAELTADKAFPADATDLAEAAISHVTGTIARMQNLESDAAVVKSDLEHANKSAAELKDDLASTKDKLREEQESASRLRDELSEQRAKISSLETELKDGRDQLSELRTQLSDGATGSETLQKRLESEERKAAGFTEQLALRQSQVGSLEEEVRSVKDKMEALASKSSSLTARYEARDGRTKELTQKLYAQSDRLTRLLERCGYAVARKPGEMTITKVPRSERVAQNPNDSSDPGNSIRRSGTLGSRILHESADLDLLYWMSNSDSEDATEADKFSSFLENLGSFDMDLFSDTIYMRIKEAEHKARKWQREARSYRDRAHGLQKDAQDKIAFRNFKDGDLALFLPTRNQQAGAWAAFNVGFPHYFLREHDAHRLRHREWLVARISRIQERVVDLSKSLQPTHDAESPNDEENDNPFQLSDGLRWYLIDATEDKPGAPSTPGMGKSTVASNSVEATANIQSLPMKSKGKNRDSITSIEGINKTLSKSLESRRSSSGSKKALPFPNAGGTAAIKGSALASETNSLRAAPADSPSGMSPVQPGLLSIAHAQRRLEDVGSSKSADHDASVNVAAAAAAGASSPQARETPAQAAASKSPEVRNVDSLLGP